MSKVILSNHALKRAKSRKMELQAIEKVVLDPERKIVLGQQKFKFFKKIGHRHYQAIATYLAKEDKWLVISVWVKGEADQPPFIWLLITAPFRLLWFLCRMLWRFINWFINWIIAKTAGKK
ncbi:MAG TPA: hypothetical protein PLQ50_01620 [Candidatus Woesebacteria bacterium]|nr:hypothetical protein [Candidatus Woesebacteria bacterium]